ncbi:Fructosamine-3-kinase [Prosthecobacter debontii]|uniref:Fructosamine-3-kinase n=1 Tax=Prosthecobacter debontii TaxID=48467 RepID=A0A1T4YD45_9BACT|nr:aminoglycoside phosphotransferase family protein [Prosthecobacter debontii]SKA99747.1 Fructosamine-3-kinase [Prosthecobacter debontii]
MSRQHIYYWKCDRPAAFHGTAEQVSAAQLQEPMTTVLRQHYPDRTITLHPGPGQGNHRTFLADIGSETLFVRIEDGPEQDTHLETESRVQEAVRALGLPTPQIHAADASRTQVPFAWQLMQVIPHPDLNHWHKAGQLSLSSTFHEIGKAIATWQGIPVQGYGPFQSDTPSFRGYHSRYADYFRLNLDKHLGFLLERQFLTLAQVHQIQRLIDDYAHLLELPKGCLVHKDLALWNILGSATEIAAYIDWDDAIAGDAMDDLSLLGCFHSGEAVAAAVEGYAKVSNLPPEHRRRFWLHLLRNMIVKAVIRVGAGYFDRNDGFFLIGAGRSGDDLRQLTMAKLHAAMQGLREDAEISTLQ